MDILEHVKPNKDCSKTDTIFSTALAYASYKSLPMTVNDNLIEQMFKDLIDLSDEYGFDYKSLIKELD